MTGSVAWKLRYSGFETFNRQTKIAYTAFNPLSLDILMDLFKNLAIPSRPIRLIGAQFSDLPPTNYHTDLFSDITRFEIS